MQKSNKLKIEDIPRVKKHAISNELTTLKLLEKIEIIYEFIDKIK